MRFLLGRPSASRLAPRLVQSNYVFKPTAVQTLRSFQPLPRGGGLTRRWASLAVVVALYVTSLGSVMANDYFVESFHNESRRHAILELEGSVAYLYLTRVESLSPEKEVAVFSTGELVEPEVAVAAAKEGIPPPLVARYASDYAVYPADVFWKLKLLWSEDGSSVAVLLRGDPIAYVSIQEKFGKSKALSVTSFFGEPWSDESYKRAFQR